MVDQIESTVNELNQFILSNSKNAREKIRLANQLSLLVSNADSSAISSNLKLFTSIFNVILSLCEDTNDGVRIVSNEIFNKFINTQRKCNLLRLQIELTTNLFNKKLISYQRINAILPRIGILFKNAVPSWKIYLAENTISALISLANSNDESIHECLFQHLETILTPISSHIDPGQSKLACIFFDKMLFNSNSPVLRRCCSRNAVVTCFCSRFVILNLSDMHQLCICKLFDKDIYCFHIDVTTLKKV
ncbi:hypothetical protein GJ496_005033 [Pomphorhynchus laevis]|nr:hypothetical protein GJ496_005033 [Pomphorhynchus laevis]